MSIIGPPFMSPWAESFSFTVFGEPECRNRRILFIGHGPKTLPVTWLTGNQMINFSH
jgi:hypothetical protein